MAFFADLKNYNLKITIMRNFSLVLLFLGSTLSFASTNNVELYDMTCVTVNTSCGIVGSACGTTTAGILEAAQDLEEWQCGGN